MLGNEIIWLATLLLTLGLVLLSFKFFREIGLYVSIVFFSVLVNVQAIKSVILFGMPVSLGNIGYGAIFLATDILSEKYSKKEARNSILIALFFVVSFNILIQLFLLLEPTQSSHPIQENLNNVFGLFLPVTISSLITFFISQNLDIFIFHYIKNKTGDKLPFLRNTLSTMISQTVDTIIFIVLLTFFGIFQDDLKSAILGIIILKIIIAIADTPFFYWARRIH